MDTGIFNVLQVFPSEQHVKETCKPGDGDGTCRYLMMGRRGWNCGKGGSFKRILDERVRKGEMHAQGDNCAGILGVLHENQAALKGKRVEYRESMPTHLDSAVFTRMEIANGMLRLFVEDADEDEREKQISSINVDYLDMDVSPTAITFSISGLGSFGGETTIFLE